MSQKPYRDGPHKEVFLRYINPNVLRLAKMTECNCRLCYLCLNPPKTFEAYASYGLDKIAEESKAMTHHAKQTFQWKKFDNELYPETYIHPPKRK